MLKWICLMPAVFVLTKVSLSSEAEILSGPTSLIVCERGSNVLSNYTLSQDSKPDFARLQTNGSHQCYILLSGRTEKSTCRRPGTNNSYEVSNSTDVEAVVYQVLVTDVQPGDAGTYCMSDYNGHENAKKMTTELVIIDDLPKWCRAVDGGNVSLSFSCHGHVNVTLNCSDGSDTNEIQLGTSSCRQDGVWYFPYLMPNVQRCTTTLELTKNCVKSCTWTHTSDVLPDSDDHQCSINNQNTSIVFEPQTNDTMREIATQPSHHIVAVVVPVVVVVVVVVAGIIAWRLYRKRQQSNAVADPHQERPLNDATSQKN